LRERKINRCSFLLLAGEGVGGGTRESGMTME